MNYEQACTIRNAIGKQYRVWMDTTAADAQIRFKISDREAKMRRAVRANYDRQYAKASAAVDVLAPIEPEVDLTFQGFGF